MRVCVFDRKWSSRRRKNNKRQAKKKVHTKQKKKVLFFLSLSLLKDNQKKNILKVTTIKSSVGEMGTTFLARHHTTHTISHAGRVFLFHEEITMTTRADISSLSFFFFKYVDDDKFSSFFSRGIFFLYRGVGRVSQKELYTQRGGTGWSLT